MITKEELKVNLPANLRSAATQELADKLNNIAADPIMSKEIADNFVSYSSVLAQGKFKIEDYMNAITYVSHKLMGKTNYDAYAATFPQRMIDMVASGYDTKKISAYVAGYNKGKLVNLIMEQTLIPMWVLNSNKFQQAIEVQADLMLNAKSEMVRTNAANSLLNALQKPKEAANLNLNIDVGTGSSSMNALADALNTLSSTQSEYVKSGKLTAKDVSSTLITEGEFTSVE